MKKEAKYVKKRQFEARDAPAGQKTAKSTPTGHQTIKKKNCWEALLDTFSSEAAPSPPMAQSWPLLAAPVEHVGSLGASVEHS